ncbi:hypothetical protein F5Y17DRAFT_457188 [Xylariaceae sp. FL0594]|nr:hypothetical protein F5Y17DRAFT_457188 [Xylariaceae sp. FL0594]
MAVNSNIIPTAFWLVYHIFSDPRSSQTAGKRKGARYSSPTESCTTTPVHWGENEAAFDHKRFVRGPHTKRHNPASLRGFGNGAHLCPGRHFASAEILLFVTMLIARFDARPVNNGGDWPAIPVLKSSQAASVDQPDFDFEVELRPREDVGQKGWRVEL